MALKLTFYGGAGKVTGSNFLIEQDGTKILVDCGIEQGGDYSAETTYAPFPYNPKEITALVITHAHLDHVGRCPKLVRDGFKGKVYMTPPTRELTELILRDSVKILADEARRRNLPALYEVQDVDAFFALVEPLEYHQEKAVAPALSLYLRNTGHILGSASVRITGKDGTTIVLTGDIGNSPSPLLPDWETVPDADALVMESVYGDRVHPDRGDRVSILKKKLQTAIKRGGAILIPAFSIERTQLMLYELLNMFAAGDLPKIPVFLDSPLAIHVTEVYEKYGSTYFKKETEEEMRREGSIFTFPFLTKTLSHQESEDITNTPFPKIIMAGAGMSHGGRIGRHEAHYLPDPRTTLFMVGYQAPGTPGRMLMDGAPRIRIGGEDISVRAHIDVMEGWSAHADRDELLKFAEAALKDNRPKVIFTALGEPSSARFLAQRIHDFLGARAVVPEYGQTWEITKDSVNKV